MYVNVYVFAEPLFSATPKPLLCAETARRCSANRLEAVPASPRAAPSEKRVIEEHTPSHEVFWLDVFWHVMLLLRLLEHIPWGYVILVLNCVTLANYNWPVFMWYLFTFTYFVKLKLLPFSSYCYGYYFQTPKTCPVNYFVDAYGSCLQRFALSVKMLMFVITI